MSHEVAKGRLHVRMLLTTPLQRAMPGRNASFPLATAGKHRDVLKTHGTTGYSTKPRFPGNLRIPAIAQPRLANTAVAAVPWRPVKLQTPRPPTIHHVLTAVTGPSSELRSANSSTHSHVRERERLKRLAFRHGNNVGCHRQNEFVISGVSLHPVFDGEANSI